MSAATTIVIADGHEVVCLGVRALLAAHAEFRVVGDAQNAAEAMRVIERHHPDVVIVDPATVDVVRALARRQRQTKVVVLTSQADERHVADALRGGAAAYVLKEAPADAILKAIRHVLSAERYLSPPLSARAIDAWLEQSGGEDDPYARLTARERQTLQLVAEGLTNQAIGERLKISPRTVETHRANLMKKLGVRTHSELVRFAVRRGVVEA